MIELIESPLIAFCGQDLFSLASSMLFLILAAHRFVLVILGHPTRSTRNAPGYSAAGLSALPVRKEAMMFRHPHYLDIPWNIHWHTEAHARHRHVWWLVGILVLIALLLIGVRAVGGEF